MDPSSQPSPSAPDRAPPRLSSSIHDFPQRDQDRPIRGQTASTQPSARTLTTSSSRKRARYDRAQSEQQQQQQPPRPSTGSEDSYSEAATPSRSTHSSLRRARRDTESEEGATPTRLQPSLPAPIPPPSIRDASHHHHHHVDDCPSEDSYDDDEENGPRYSPAVSGPSLTTSHPVVEFLASVQLQGYAARVVLTQGLSSFAALERAVQSEEAAAGLLGPLASRQQRADLWKGLLRRRSDNIKEERREEQEARRRLLAEARREAQERKRAAAAAAAAETAAKANTSNGRKKKATTTTTTSKSTAASADAPAAAAAAAVQARLSVEGVAAEMAPPTTTTTTSTEDEPPQMVDDGAPPCTSDLSASQLFDSLFCTSDSLHERSRNEMERHAKTISSGGGRLRGGGNGPGAFNAGSTTASQFLNALKYNHPEADGGEGHGRGKAAKPRITSADHHLVAATAAVTVGATAATSAPVETTQISLSLTSTSSGGSLTAVMELAVREAREGHSRFRRRHYTADASQLAAIDVDDGDDGDGERDEEDDEERPAECLEPAMESQASSSSFGCESDSADMAELVLETAQGRSISHWSTNGFTAPAPPPPPSLSNPAEVHLAPDAAPPVVAPKGPKDVTMENEEPGEHQQQKVEAEDKEGKGNCDALDKTADPAMDAASTPSAEALLLLLLSVSTADACNEAGLVSDPSSAGLDSPPASPPRQRSQCESPHSQHQQQAAATQEQLAAVEMPTGAPVTMASEPISHASSSSPPPPAADLLTALRDDIAARLRTYNTAQAWLGDGGGGQPVSLRAVLLSVGPGELSSLDNTSAEDLVTVMPFAQSRQQQLQYRGRQTPQLDGGATAAASNTVTPAGLPSSNDYQGEISVRTPPLSQPGIFRSTTENPTSLLLPPSSAAAADAAVAYNGGAAAAVSQGGSDDARSSLSSIAQTITVGGSSRVSGGHHHHHHRQLQPLGASPQEHQEEEEEEKMGSLSPRLVEEPTQISSDSHCSYHEEADDDGGGANEEEEQGCDIGSASRMLSFLANQASAGEGHGERDSCNSSGGAVQDEGGEEGHDNDDDEDDDGWWNSLGLGALAATNATQLAFDPFLSGPNNINSNRNGELSSSTAAARASGRRHTGVLDVLSEEEEEDDTDDESVVDMDTMVIDSCESDTDRRRYGHDGGGGKPRDEDEDGDDNEEETLLLPPCDLPDCGGSAAGRGNSSRHSHGNPGRGGGGGVDAGLRGARRAALRHLLDLYGTTNSNALPLDQQPTEVLAHLCASLGLHGGGLDPSDDHSRSIKNLRHGHLFTDPSERAQLAREAAVHRLRMVAVRALFRYAVAPATLHRVPRISGLPYRRVKASELLLAGGGGRGALLTAEDLSAARLWAKAEEALETDRCVFAALAAEATDRIEALAARGGGRHGNRPTTTAGAAVASLINDEGEALGGYRGTTGPPPVLVSLEKALLMEPVDADSMARAVQREFPFVTFTRVGRMLRECDIPLEVVQFNHSQQQEEHDQRRQELSPSPTPASPFPMVAAAASISSGGGDATPELRQSYSPYHHHHSNSGIIGGGSPLSSAALLAANGSSPSASRCRSPQPHDSHSPPPASQELRRRDNTRRFFATRGFRTRGGLGRGRGGGGRGRGG